MKINQNSTQQNFRAIKLSNYDYKFARNIAMSLKYRNIDVVGKRQIYMSNDFDTKQKMFNYIRNASHFYPSQCGFVFLPWSQESWIVANRGFEQELLKTVQLMDSGAYINLTF